MSIAWRARSRLPSGYAKVPAVKDRDVIYAYVDTMSADANGQKRQRSEDCLVACHSGDYEALVWAKN